MTFEWKHVAVVGLLLAATVGALVLGEKVIAATLAGIVGGMIIPGKPRGAAVLAAGMLLGAAAPACSVDQASRVARLCAAPALERAAADTAAKLLEDVSAAAARQPAFDRASWEAHAVSLGLRYGWASVACAVRHLLDDQADRVAGPACVRRRCHSFRPELLPRLRFVLARAQREI